MKIIVFVMPLLALALAFVTDPDPKSLEEQRSLNILEEIRRNIEIETPVIPFFSPGNTATLEIGTIKDVFVDLPSAVDRALQSTFGVTASDITSLGPIGVASILVAIVGVGTSWFLGLFMLPLQIANQVLAIVSLSLLAYYGYNTDLGFTGLFTARTDDLNEISVEPPAVVSEVNSYPDWRDYSYLVPSHYQQRQLKHSPYYSKRLSKRSVIIPPPHSPRQSPSDKFNRGSTMAKRIASDYIRNFSDR